MRRTFVPVFALATLFGALPVSGRESLKRVSPSACMPEEADYTFVSWANGWQGRAPARPQIFCIQTGRYGLAINVETLELLHFGAVTEPQAYEAAASRDHDVVFRLPKGNLELSLSSGGTKYRCIRAARNQKDSQNFPVRMIESGRFVQRCDILQLEFADDEGNRSSAEGRLEIVAWPDRLAFILEITAQQDLQNAQLEIGLACQGHVAGTVGGRQTADALRAGQTCSAAAVLQFDSQKDGASDAVVVQATNLMRNGEALAVEYDDSRGWHRVRLPEERWAVAEEPDRLERVRVTLANPTSREQVVRLLFDARDGTGITGLTPMLRDREGNPTGISVQISKNWHRKKERPMLYEGPWFHGFTLLRLPARSAVECEFNRTWARWGGVAAASHAQLCLIGWGWNQLWDEAAIGSWGESICYELDGVQKRCMIDDVRPLMVWRMGSDEKRKWGWTNNVGGGDFLVYYDDKGQYQHMSRMRAAYNSHGPNLTNVTYAGLTADGHIAMRVTVSSPRCDDVNRAYHTFRYDVLKPTRFTRLAFYQLGSDNYHWHQYNRMARGNESGVIEEWKPKRGGERYHRTGIACDGVAPWFSLHDAIEADHFRPKKGAWANRGLVIRSWKARLGGKEARPFASVYGTNADNVPSANLELSPPPDLERLEIGDFVEAEVELIVMPMSADDYYGPNENLRASLRTGANTWKPIHRQAIGNNLNLKISRGEIVERYPVRVHVDQGQTAELEITGGVGYVPITFSGLSDYKGYDLLMSIDGETSRVDQAVHGRDYWQTDHDPLRRRWSITYNVLLDTPGDVARKCRLLFGRRIDGNAAESSGASRGDAPRSK